MALWATERRYLRLSDVSVGPAVFIGHVFRGFRRQGVNRPVMALIWLMWVMACHAHCWRVPRTTKALGLR